MRNSIIYAPSLGGLWAARTFREKANNKVVSFSTLFFMFTLTFTPEKKLERVIENEGDEFQWKINMKIS